MKTLRTFPGQRVALGHQGENLALTVIFNIGAWADAYGPGTTHLVHMRTGDAEAYPVAVTQEGTEVSWEVSDADTAVDGYGKYELRYIVGETVVKSSVGETYVRKALQYGAEAPDPIQGWVDHMTEKEHELLEAVGEAKEASEKAAGSAGDALTFANAAAQAAGSAEEAARNAALAAQNVSDLADNARLSAKAAADQAGQAAGSAKEAKDAVEEARNIVDGADVVKSVNGQTPDENGNVRIEVGSGSGVDVTAKPGQLIRVQAVDENGKPTAWEAVPFGWTEKGEIAELPLVGEWGGEDADGDGITDSAMFVASAPIGLVVDNTYTVKCNGTDYTVNALDLNSLSGGEMPVVFLGNLAGMGGEDTGEPFMVMEIPEELSAEMNGLYGMIQVMGAVESFSIYGQRATHHKIPNKFIDGNWVKNTVAPAIETAKSEAVTEANGYTDTKLNELKVEVPLFDVNALLPKNFKYGDEYNTSSADETLFHKIHDAGIVKVRIPDNIFGYERFITVYPVVSPNDVGISLIIPGNTILGESQKGKSLGVIDIRYNYSTLEIKTGRISVSATS